MICIICKKEFGQAPPEHFIPEHIGGMDTINCVCFKCNHELGSEIDGRIRKNIQLSMAIDSTALPRYAEILHPEGSIQRKVRIADGRTNELKYSTQGPTGPIIPTGLKLTIRPEEDLLLNKVFAKILFETIAFKYGCEEVLFSKYDPFRIYLKSSSEEFPKGLSIRLVAATITGHKITELVSINQLSMQVVSNNYEVTGLDDLKDKNIVIVENIDNRCQALVILLGGKKSGRIVFESEVPEGFIYVSKLAPRL